MRSVLALLASLAMFASVQLAAADTACVACALVLGLLEQDGSKGPSSSAADPDTVCASLGLCDGTCNIFAGAWPAKSPNFPTDGFPVDDANSPPGVTKAYVAQVASALQARAGDVPSSLLPTLQRLKDERDRRRAAAEEPLDFYGAVNFVVRGLSSSILESYPCEDFLNISCDISRFADGHLPLADADNDAHAGGNIPLLSDGFRGAVWRGRDCNDNDATVYAGRDATAAGADLLADSNCNGIVGGNSSGSYENLYCSGPNAPLGVAILGDSAAAHFHIPPQWVNAYNFNLSGVLEAASNELDWPACSWSTGFRNTEDCPTTTNVAMNSIYQRMRARNLCMHRDFQNIGVNGARVGSIASSIINSFQRNPQTDRPLLVFWALIGNDVCNGHPGMGSMTTVAEFQASVLQGLAYLDTVLPKGSHVAFLGLADGTILWNITHTLTHPLGVGYPALYEYLACNGATPCWGWMNANATWRNLTQQRANELSAVYDTIIAQNNQTFKNFDMYHVQVDWVSLVAEYVAAGGNPADIIEPVDGFHPSQTGQQLLAEVVWDQLATNRPTWIPRVNPYNAQIAAQFGDQGGY